MMLETRIHPVTGQVLTRQVRTQTVVIGPLSAAVQVPGWYPEGDGDAIHSGQDLAEEEAVFQALRKSFTLSDRLRRRPK